MFYYIYQITNLVNNKIYVGVHKTKNLDDGYMGSGKVIKRAIEKYGLDNFKKDILEMFEDSASMYAKEKEIVMDEFLLKEQVYNLRRGGTGGFDYINKNGLNYKGYDSVVDKNRNITPMQGQRGVEIREKAKIGREQYIRVTNLSELRRFEYATGIRKENGFKNKTHTEESKRKMSISKKGTKMGSANPSAKTIVDCDGNVFNTVIECARFHNICVQTVRNRVIAKLYKEI